jgi:UDP-glucuronate 4-epimerase
MKTEHSSLQRTYLVTGAAGFIASKVCEMLLAEGHTVVGIDNLNDYYDVRLKYYRLTRVAELAGCEAKQVADLNKLVVGPQVSGLRSQVSLKSDRFTFHTLDIEDLPALERVFEQSEFTAVFNLAARAGVRYSLEFPELYRRTNILGEENVLKCQVKYGVKKHVLASSSSVYAGCPMPFTEDAVLGKMQSPYAETKRAAELLAKEYHEKHGLDVTVLRYFTVFGPAGRPDMAPFRFIKWIDEGTPITLYGDGTQARDFTYIDDIARGTILAGKLHGGRMSEDGRGLSVGNPQVSGFRSQVSSYDVINLGGGNNPLSITDMIAIIGEAVGKNAQIAHQSASAADMHATWADINQAKRLLGWAPATAPAEGFKRAVDWHLAEIDLVRSLKV